MAMALMPSASRHRKSGLAEKKAASLASDSQRLRLSSIPWQAYVRLGEALRDRHIRVTYDKGEMEIMTLSFEHEHRKRRLGRLIEALTEELEIDVASGGATTFQREDLEKGLEGDEVYWIKHESLVRDKKRIDPAVDPPPDLAVEMDVSSSSMDRMAIYAALRVPEVWRWDGRILRVYLLTRKGAYKESKRSKAFPFLPLREFAGFLTKTGVSETQLIRSFRDWVRQQSARGWK
jgi:Uma2 family endonuclease